MAENETIPENEETNNVVLLRAYVRKIFKNIAESVSEEEFKNTLPLLKDKPGVAEKLHKAMMKELFDSMSADFEATLADGSLSSGLGKLTKLVQEAPDAPDKKAWRPPGDVNEHVRSFDVREMIKASEELEKEVLDMEAENERMKNEIIEKRAKIRMIEERVNSSKEKLPHLIQNLEKRVDELHDLADSIDDKNLDLEQD